MSTLSSTVSTMGSNVTVDIYRGSSIRMPIPAGCSGSHASWTSVLACVTYYYVPLLLELFRPGLALFHLSPVLIAILLLPHAQEEPDSAGIPDHQRRGCQWQIFMPRELKAGASFFAGSWTPGPGRGTHFTGHTGGRQPLGRHGVIAFPLGVTCVFSQKELNLQDQLDSGAGPASTLPVPLLLQGEGSRRPPELPEKICMADQLQNIRTIPNRACAE